jgi:hypothetical protein
MKYKLIIVMLLIFKSVLLFGQQMRVISGTLKDQSNGEPLIGVNIMIEGTTNGVVTDINGKYRIVAPLGSTLIISYIGYNAEKVLVTENNSKPLGSELLPNRTDTTTAKKPKAKLKSSYTPIQTYPVNENDSAERNSATATFSSIAPIYRLNRIDWGNFWYDIKPERVSTIQFGDKEVKIAQQHDRYLRIPHVTFISSFSLDKSIRLPELQHQYAQGRPMNGSSLWRGPETGEVFSFGPAIQNLEYDGSAYNFDNNGRLVNQGIGNGKAAQAYDPVKIFRTGSSFINSLQVNKRDERFEYSILYNNKRVNGIIPTAYKNENTFEFLFGKKISRSFRIKNNFSYDGYKSRLISGSPAVTVLLASVFTTPPTFDNANGLSSSKATKDKSAYMLANGQRSSSNASNNPYWLVNNLIDKERYAALNEALELNVQIIKDLRLSWKGVLSNQQVSNANGYPSGTNGRNPIQMEREHHLFSLSSLSMLDYYLGIGSWHQSTLNSQLSHSFKFSESNKDWNVGDGVNDNPIHSNLSLRVHNWGLSTAVNYKDKIMAKFTQNLNYNEYSSAKQHLYSPSVSAGINVHNFIEYYKRNFLDYCKIRANWGYMYSEMPLSFTYGSYAYQSMDVAQFQQSFFDTELVPDFTLQPEKILKKGIGADLAFFNSRLALTAEYYENTTFHGIFPVLEAGKPVLENCADYRDRGFEMDVTYTHYRWNQFSMRYKLVFTSNRNKVVKLHSPQNIIPLAGFNNIHSALVEGLPSGVIMGSSYQRNAHGQMIIGENGYPLVDPDLKVLADPNPNFTLGFEMNLTYKRLAFNCLMEFSQGGKIWNGTESVLSYYGVSQSSAEQRNVTGFIYAGVKQDGSANTTPVDFANPSAPFSSNRWQQYGVGGVAEDAIQDATFFRIKELAVSYAIGKKYHYFIELRGFLTNPLLIASSKGVDPSSVLWSTANGRGLQLFNMPSVTSVGLGIRLKL